jgi:hypothetical protein
MVWDIKGAMMKTVLRMQRMVLAVIVLFLANSAFAAASFVGSFNVFDGPAWSLEPKPLSAREVAAMLYGGSFSDYAISISSSTDPNSITHTAWVDGFLDSQYLQTAASENFVVVPSSGVYNDYPAYSAWVCDHADCAPDGFVPQQGWEGNNYKNYVWRLVAAPVPEPYPFLMFLAALPMLLMGRKVYGTPK